MFKNKVHIYQVWVFHKFLKSHFQVFQYQAQPIILKYNLKRRRCVLYFYCFALKLQASQTNKHKGVLAVTMYKSGRMFPKLFMSLSDHNELH